MAKSNDKPARSDRKKPDRDDGGRFASGKKGKEPEETAAQGTKTAAEAVVKEAAKKPKAKIPRRGRPSATAEAELAIAQQNTVMIIAMLNSIAVLAVRDDEARMNSAEKTVIEDSMQRTFERMDLDPTGRMAAVMDPITILMGLSAWGIRLVRFVRERRELEREDGREPAAEKTEIEPETSPRKNPIEGGPDGKVKIIEATPELVRAESPTFIRMGSGG